MALIYSSSVLYAVQTNARRTTSMHQFGRAVREVYTLSMFRTATGHSRISAWRGLQSDGPTTAGRRKSSHSPRHPRPSNQSSFRPIIPALFLQGSRSDDSMSDGVDGRVNHTGSPRLFGLKGRCLVAKLTPSYPYTLQSA